MSKYINEREEFNNWNELKKEINSKTRNIFYKEREIWWANFGKNVGNEQNGKNENFSRPVLIFKKFNENSFWGLPVSSKIREGKYYHIIGVCNQKNSINLSQLKLFSSKRIFSRIERINEKDFINIKDKIIKIIKTPS